MGDLIRELNISIRSLDAAPQAVARATISAIFDHLLNPKELDYDAPPSEHEAYEVEELLVRFVRDEGDDVRDFIRRHPPQPTE